MQKKSTLKTGIAAALMLAFGMGAVQAQAQEVVRLGNLKFAHYGAVSYIKEIAPKCGIKVEEHIFMGAVQAQAQEVVRLGNLKFAHYGAVSYIKEIAPKCGIKVEEHIFAKGHMLHREIKKIAPGSTHGTISP